MQARAALRPLWAVSSMTGAETWLAIVRQEPRPAIVAKLHARIAGDRRRGTGYAVHADFCERLMTEHQPTSLDQEAMCTKCSDEQWPCGEIASILAPD